MNIARTIARRTPCSTLMATRGRYGLRRLSESASPAPKSSGSSVAQRFTAFCVGAAGTSAFYYVQLHQDIWDSTVKIEKSLSALKLDAVQETASLRHRVAVLEKELAALKSKF